MPAHDSKYFCAHDAPFCASVPYESRPRDCNFARDKDEIIRLGIDQPANISDLSRIHRVLLAWGRTRLRAVLTFFRWRVRREKCTRNYSGYAHQKNFLSSRSFSWARRGTYARNEEHSAIPRHR